MNSTHSINSLHLAINLVGCKYKAGGCTPNGFDCWGLVWYFLNKTGQEIPNMYDYATRNTPQSLVNVTGDALSTGQWIKLDNPEEGCIVPLGRNGIVTHVGVWLHSESKVLHATSGGVVCETISKIKTNRNLTAQFRKWHQST